MFGFGISPRLLRIIQIASIFSVLACLTVVYFPRRTTTSPTLNFPHHVESGERQRHPIDGLRDRAKKDLRSLIKKQSYTLEAAELAYLERRGRRPPPGFNEWFKYAQANNAVIVEDFFDRIYTDLDPFWGMPAKQIRTLASQWFFRISIRDGQVTKRMDHERPWMNLWGDMVSHISMHLPDMDIAINEMDEPRIVAPWEVVDDHMTKAAQTKKVTPTDKVMSNFSGTYIPEEEPQEEVDWNMRSEGSYWDYAVIGCHPKSPARDGYVPVRDFTTLPPVFNDWPEKSFEGYVQNWTYVKSACEHPHLQEMHATFVEPLSISTSDKLIPMFGGSKLSMNNEILLPAAMYWTDDPFYSGGSGHGGPWKEKKDQVIWRGAASGGRNRAENWTRFQRHRFVAMVNSTTVGRAERGELIAPNFALQKVQPYQLSASESSGGLSKWLKQIADAAFVHLLCFPDNNPPWCEYTDPWFEVAPAKPMQEQYAYKYLPDIDGNSFSGRYRGFLMSTSLPIKATIYDEWHDPRLIPWLHFVPMHNTFADVYGILEYFIGTESKPGHDDVAGQIARDGKDWADKVLRREDMVIYVFRLLLEYGRLCDDHRENLGWVRAK